MERWWTAEEIPAARPYLMELFQRDIRFCDFDNQVVEAVLRLAARGKVEVGEKDGRAVVRDTDGVCHPDIETRPKHPVRRRCMTLVSFAEFAVALATLG